MTRLRTAYFLALLSMPLSVLAQNPRVKIQISSEKSVVFSGDVFLIDIHMTNIGPADLKPMKSMFCQFQNQWVIDNPRILYNRTIPANACPDPSLPNGSIQPSERYIVLKPGEEHSDKMDLHFPKGSDMSSPLTFRLGYKDHPGFQIVWSNTISIPIKKDEVFPVKIEASVQATNVTASALAMIPGAPPPSTQGIKVSAHVRNASQTPQHIGLESCCVHDLNDWRIDNESLGVLGGNIGCLKTNCGVKPVVLKPGESYEQTLTVLSLPNRTIKSGPLTFRVGIQNTGHLPGWSNPLTVEILP